MNKCSSGYKKRKRIVPDSRTEMKHLAVPVGHGARINHPELSIKLPLSSRALSFKGTLQGEDQHTRLKVRTDSEL